MIDRSLSQQKESEQINAKLRGEVEQARVDLRKALKAQSQVAQKILVDTADKALDADPDFIE